MVIFGQWEGKSITISVKANCLTLSLECGGKADVFSYDYAGRLWTAFYDSISYRRGLDGKMVAKWTAGLTPKRRWLLPDEARRVETLARQQVAGIWQAIQSGRLELSAGLTPQAELGFRQALAFDEARSQADSEHYFQVYQPVGILPPDQYMAVVLQATEGCAFNTCSFCDFYKNRPFRIKSPEEFLAHAQAVRDYIGPGLSLRRTIFLGDANALVAPMSRLLPLIDRVHQVYDVNALGGIFAFLDGFSAEKKTTQDWAALAARGLERVYIGLESGSEPLLRFLNKPGKAADAVKAVRALKTGGVSVGVIVLLGAGGKSYDRQHVQDTIRALNAMKLDQDDLIYFSELVVHEGLPYARQAFEAQLQPLTGQARQAQGERIEAGLRFSRLGGLPPISRYDIREFVY